MSICWAPMSWYGNCITRTTCWGPPYSLSGLPTHATLPTTGCSLSTQPAWPTTGCERSSYIAQYKFAPLAQHSHARPTILVFWSINSCCIAHHGLRFINSCCIAHHGLRAINPHRSTGYEQSQKIYLRPTLEYTKKGCEQSSCTAHQGLRAIRLHRPTKGYEQPSCIAHQGLRAIKLHRRITLCHRPSHVNMLGSNEAGRQTALPDNMLGYIKLHHPMPSPITCQHVGL